MLDGVITGGGVVGEPADGFDGAGEVAVVLFDADAGGGVHGKLIDLVEGEEGGMVVVAGGFEGEREGEIGAVEVDLIVGGGDFHGGEEIGTDAIGEVVVDAGEVVEVDLAGIFFDDGGGFSFGGQQAVTGLVVLVADGGEELVSSFSA